MGSQQHSASMHPGLMDRPGSSVEDRGSENRRFVLGGSSGLLLRPGRRNRPANRRFGTPGRPWPAFSHLRLHCLRLHCLSLQETTHTRWRPERPECPQCPAAQRTCTRPGLSRKTGINLYTPPTGLRSLVFGCRLKRW